MKFYLESAAQRSARVEEMALPGTHPEFRFLIIGVGMIGREHIQVTKPGSPGSTIPTREVSRRHWRCLMAKWKRIQLFTTLWKRP